LTNPESNKKAGGIDVPTNGKASKYYQDAKGQKRLFKIKVSTML
jgi:hypothetical protein